MYALAVAGLIGTGILQENLGLAQSLEQAGRQPGQALESPARSGTSMPLGEPADKLTRTTEPLTLEKALHLALNHSPELARVNAEVARTNALEKEARWRADSMKVKEIYTYERALAKYVQPMSASAQKTASLNQLNYLKNLISYRTTAAILDYHVAVEQVAAAQDALALARENKRLAEVKIEAGTGTKYDLLLAEAAVSAKEAGLARSKAAEKTLRSTVNLLLGRHLDDGLKLAEFPTQEAGELKLEEMRKQALEQDPNVIRTKAMGPVEEESVRVAGTYLSTETAVYEQARFSLAKTKEELQAAEDQVLLKLERAYNNYLAAIVAVKSSEDGVSKAKEALRLAKLRYTAGVGTIQDVLAVQEAYTKSRTEELAAKAEQYKWALQLKYLVFE